MVGVPQGGAAKAAIPSVAGASADPLLDLALRAIDTALRRDPGGRGLASRVISNPLGQAARSLASGSRVLIITGFCVRSAMTGETDGPPGAAALAGALRVSGIDMRIVTDEYSADLVRVACGVYGMTPVIHTVPRAQAEADAAMKDILADYLPTHAVAIERPGMAADGHCYSMRGESLDDLVPRLDYLLEPGYPRSYTTIAIGDGGNELGMGGLPESLKSGIEHGEKIFAATAADFIIAAGVSNWGACALAAALSLMTGRDGLPDPGTERAVLECLNRAGAVDGATRARTATVDGLADADYFGILREIHAIYLACRAGKAAESADSGCAGDSARKGSV